MNVHRSRWPLLGGVTIAGLLVGGLVAPRATECDGPVRKRAGPRLPILVSTEDPSMRTEDPGVAPDLQALQAAGRAIQPLHAPKARPGPGDWLATHDEPGQTFDEYRASDPNRPTARRTTIDIQPLGELDAVQSKLIAAT